MAHTESLQMEAVIGFKGTVPGGLVLHPDNEHLIFPLGCTVVVRNVIKQTQFFLQGHDNHISTIAISRDGKYLASGIYPPKLGTMCTRFTTRIWARSVFACQSERATHLFGIRELVT